MDGRLTKQTTASILRELPDEYLKCRLIAHLWDDDEEDREVWGDPTRALNLRCARCGMVRDDSFDWRGGLLDRDYDPPEGYQIPSELRPNKEQLRREWIRRQKIRGECS